MTWKTTVSYGNWIPAESEERPPHDAIVIYARQSPENSSYIIESGRNYDNVQDKTHWKILTYSPWYQDEMDKASTPNCCSL